MHLFIKSHTLLISASWAETRAANPHQQQWMDYCSYSNPGLLLLTHRKHNTCNTFGSLVTARANGAAKQPGWQKG